MSKNTKKLKDSIFSADNVIESMPHDLRPKPHRTPPVSNNTEPTTSTSEVGAGTSSTQHSPQTGGDTPCGRYGDPDTALDREASADRDGVMESDLDSGLVNVDTGVKKTVNSSEGQSVRPSQGQEAGAQSELHDRVRDEALMREKEFERRRFMHEQEQRDWQVSELYKKWEIEKLERTKAGVEAELKLNQLNEELSKLKSQLSQKNNAIPNQAPLMASTQNSPSYPPVDQHPLTQNKLSDPRPHLVSPPYNPRIQVEAYSATGGFGDTPRTTSSQLTAVLNNFKTVSEQVGLKDLKREEDFIELRLQKFDDFCSLRDIQSEADRYKLLESLVCLRDTQTFKDKYEAESRDYQNLKKFLIGGEGRLNHVFTTVQLSHSITHTELDHEVTRFVAELRDPDILRKFVTVYLAPPQLQKEIKKKLHLKSDQFGIAVARVCDLAAQERKASAMNVNYTNHRNPPRQTRDGRTKPRRNEPNYVCQKHEIFGPEAWYCGDKDYCSMRDQCKPKNERPNSPQ